MAEPRVAILMTTYNGEAHLNEQFASLASQTHPHWSLAISDDGSRDGTLRLITEFREMYGVERIKVFGGPRKGFAANFLSLACRASVEAEYYAFCDQDDVWLPDKLARAVAALQQIPPETPAVYGTRTVLTDEAGNEIGLSPLFSKPAAFGNALVQCIAGGNTMVFNQAARQLIVEAGPEVPVAGHDWWLYQLVTGCGGVALYDPVPSVRYRQHAKNLMGSNISLLSKLLRIRLLFKGTFRDWNDRNIAAWQTMRHRFCAEQRAIFEHFIQARQQPLLPRCIGMIRAGIYRQTLLGNLGLIAAVLTKTI